MQVNGQDSGAESAVDNPKTNDFVIFGEDTENAAAVEVPPAAVVTVPDAGEDEEDEESAPSQTANDDGKKPRRGGFQKKLARAEAARDFYKEELDKLRGTPAGTTAPVEAKPAVTESDDDVGPEPKLEDFDTVAEYDKAIDDRRRKIIRAEIRQEDKAKEDREKQRLATEKAQTVVTTFNQRKDAFKATVPDFDQTMEDASDVPMNAPMQHVMLTSEIGPAIQYHLAKNPDLARSIHDMHPYDAAVALARLEVELKPKTAATTVKNQQQVATRTVSNAPPPINPVGNATAGNVDSYSEDMSGDAYMQARKSGKIK